MKQYPCKIRTTQRNVGNSIKMQITYLNSTNPEIGISEDKMGMC